MHKESRSGSMTSDGCEEMLDTVDDTRKLVKDLRDKTRAQAQQLLAWRRAYKMQEILISRLHREKADQLKTLSSKLLLFESRLIRKQKDISTMLTNRENIIYRQQKIIDALTSKLIENKIEPPVAELDGDSGCLDLESLNDSDSAVVLEEPDNDASFHFPPSRGYRGGSSFDYGTNSNNNNVTVVRSISDAIDPNLKYTIRRTNGFLRRPEILETVYSVEEDGDDQNNDGKSDANKKRDAFATSSAIKAISNEDKDSLEKRDADLCHKKLEQKSGSGEECKKQDAIKNEEKAPAPKNPQVTTYNRVMSNHRSVTKPKDVKYKRINKAKSKSLEELRGRLKNWVEQGTKIASLSLEHSQSYA